MIHLQLPLTIRDATESDLPRIVEIYNTAVPGRLATADLEPISVDSRQAWYNIHHPQTRPLWVAQVREQIIGWLSFQDFYGRPAYKATAELSIYIAPEHRGCGVGHQLLHHAIQTSPSLELETLLAFVFAHNQPSLRLFEKFGFQRWGYLPKVAQLDGIQRDLAILGLSLVKRDSACVSRG
ncbi:N-acetyltransferase [Desertifilum sp. FACHB-1129]|uniref:Phosphinothricin acetyltransferase n=2 Tax=Desertifilum tharense IPPAS B-1220 TaxID=1781255 RepID=A0A1E5QMK9_9CYAN|nr:MULTISPECIES: GNAT family N-acetyltransferase [Desertifilum]MDA0213325.1 GNAT family N-acetyltransferase [Cyanobacteria bacterium FC1]MBD2313249.1 N-acetyltransferase [Desertifilum sp. FACHB-1129]MBD2324290.1 N-acetyltransferase [Desertifilum sp. FACHB-866]MBD2334305.1 N-acetyltransferase [Desertifilum sp. FACHB-868]OEJ75563.1 phosphinothricin acetyltransferase [Desertifilum tharense IPPAS B-1220]